MPNEALFVTLAATITVMPIIVYNFRQLSLVTLLSNCLVLPAQTGNTLCSWVDNRCWDAGTDGKVVEW
jgi:predicted membrane metal-binding protein